MITTTGLSRERYANARATTDPRPSRFTDPAAYAAWAARADRNAPPCAPIVSPLDGTPFTPSKEYASAFYFDTRANRALHGTMTGESMATWGPHYMRQARAMLRLAPQGRLWVIA
jgi:hypothetical protein